MRWTPIGMHARVVPDEPSADWPAFTRATEPFMICIQKVRPRLLEHIHALFQLHTVVMTVRALTSSTIQNAPGGLIFFVADAQPHRCRHAPGAHTALSPHCMTIAFGGVNLERLAVRYSRAVIYTMIVPATYHARYWASCMREVALVDFN